MLDRAIASVLTYADQGSDRLVLLTALANGVAEEVFFRGALYAAVGPSQPVAAIDRGVHAGDYDHPQPGAGAGLWRDGHAVRAAAARLRRHPGADCSRHLIWSTLMLRFLPPLFRRRPKSSQPESDRRSGAGWA